MKPFNSVNEAAEWIYANAVGTVEVFVFNSSMIMAGVPRHLVSDGVILGGKSMQFVQGAYCW